MKKKKLYYSSNSLNSEPSVLKELDLSLNSSTPISSVVEQKYIQFLLKFFHLLSPSMKAGFIQRYGFNSLDISNLNFRLRFFYVFSYFIFVFFFDCIYYLMFFCEEQFPLLLYIQLIYYILNI
jgi:hypothetical protein